MKEKNLAIKLASSAILLAFSIILTRFLSILLFGGLIRLELGQIALQLAGLLLGPFYGATVGLFSDLIGTMLISVPFHWGFTLDYLMIGLIFGLGRLILKQKIYSFPSLLCIQIITTLVVNLLMRSYWLAGLQHISYRTVILTRFLPVLLSGIVYLFFTYTIIKLGKKARLKLFP